MTLVRMIDIQAWGVTVQGHPVVGADSRVLHDVQLAYAVTTSAGLVAALQRVLADATDATDEGNKPGDLYYRVIQAIDLDGVTEIHIHVERIAGVGHCAYYATMVDRLAPTFPAHASEDELA